MGESNEVGIVIEGKSSLALLDTGSMVSTVSQSLVSELNLNIQPLNQLLRVENAGGHQLQYLGFIEASTYFPDLTVGSVDVLFLVVPDTKFHAKVPVIIGTNVLRSGISEGHSGDIPSPWRLAFQSLANQLKLDSFSGSLGQVKSTKAVVIPAEGRIMVNGLTCASATACMRMTVVSEEPGNSRLPCGLLLTPGLLHLEPGKSSS